MRRCSLLCWSWIVLLGACEGDEKTPDLAALSAGAVVEEGVGGTVELEVATLNLAVGFGLERLSKYILMPATVEDLSADTASLVDEMSEAKPAERLAALAKALAEDAPEVIALQEVMRVRFGEEVVHDFLAALLEGLAAEGLTYEAAYQETEPLTLPFWREGVATELSFNEGNAILVRDEVELVDEEGRIFEAAVGPIPILEASFKAERGVQRVLIRKQGLDVELYNTHLEIGAFAGVHASQAEELVEYLGSYQIGTPRVLLGDLNAVPGSKTYLDLASLPMADVALLVETPPAPTCCQVLFEGEQVTVPLQRIDYIFASGLTSASEVRTGLSDGAVPGASELLHPSDHLGVLATLRFPKAVE